MKTSKIKNIQGSGTFKELYVFELQLENGDNGKIYKKSQESGVKVGDEITYTINEKGSIKIQREEYQKQSYSNKQSVDVQSSIIKQSSLKAAVELCSAYVKVGNTVSSSDVLRIADTFTNWVNGANTEVVKQAEKVLAQVDNTDLPF